MIKISYNLSTAFLNVILLHSRQILTGKPTAHEDNSKL